MSSSFDCERCLGSSNDFELKFVLVAVIFGGERTYYLAHIFSCTRSDGTSGCLVDCKGPMCGVLDILIGYY